MHKFRYAILIVAAVLLPSLAFPQITMRTSPLNLEQMVQRSGDIVHGHVVAVRVEPHPQLNNLKTVVVTLKVSENLKGAASNSFTFRQYVWDLRMSGTALGYAKGQELVLFMNRNSEYGLTSPVGLEQGRFRVTRDKPGNPMVVNGYGNASLLRDVDVNAGQSRVRLSSKLLALAKPGASGPVPLADLKEAVRGFVRVTK